MILAVICGSAEAFGQVGAAVQRGNRAVYYWYDGRRRHAGATIHRGAYSFHRVHDGRRFWSGVTYRDRFGRSFTYYR